MSELRDQLLHALLGAAVALPVASAGWWRCAIVGAVLALAREHAQHYPMEGWRWITTGKGRWLDVVVITVAGAGVGRSV